MQDLTLAMTEMYAVAKMLIPLAIGVGLLAGYLLSMPRKY